MDVMILAGGLSHERDVSVRAGRRVAEELRDRGLSVTVHDVDTGLLPALRDNADAVVWPLLHGASGEDGSLQALLELAGSRYVGTRSKEARVAWVKPVAKAVYGTGGVQTPDFVTLPQSLFREVGAEQVLDAIVDRFGLPLAVKPARGGSALGVSLVTERDQLARADLLTRRRQRHPHSVARQPRLVQPAFGHRAVLGAGHRQGHLATGNGMGGLIGQHRLFGHRLFTKVVSNCKFETLELIILEAFIC